MRNFENSFCFLLFLALLPTPFVRAEENRLSVTSSGSFKSILGLQQLRETNVFPNDTVPFTEQRLRLATTISKRWFRLELADELSVLGQRENVARFPVPDLNPKTTFNLDWQVIQSNQWNVWNRLDRAYVQLTFDPIEIRIGRQVVAIGVGKIFNAVSQVPHRSLRYVDPEYPVTQDGVAVIWNGPLSIEARFLPKIEGQQQNNFHLRAKGSKFGYDVAMTAGRSEDKVFIGMETAGNLGESLLRGEMVGYRWQEKDYGQFLVGFDRVFSRRWNLQAEFFYNGFGKSGNYVLEPFPQTASPLRGIWYFGENLSYEISERMKATLGSVINLGDPSALFHATVSRSLTANTELELGQYLNWGSGANSEFGGLLNLPAMSPVPIQLGSPDLSYLLFKWYF